MATVAINATDHFGLGANFHPQSSSANTVDERRNNKDENGNFECETMVGTKVEYSTTFSYCNATPDIATDLGTALTAFGYVLASGGATADMFVNSLSISFRDGEYAEVTMNGVAYSDGTMPAATTGLVSDVSAAVPAGAGFGVPVFTGVNLGGPPAVSAATGLTINISCNHVMSTDGLGNFFVANQISFTAEADAEYVGVPTSYTAPTGWTADNYSTNDSNESHDTVSWSGHRYFDKA